MQAPTGDTCSHPCNYYFKSQRLVEQLRMRPVETALSRNTSKLEDAASEPPISVAALGVSPLGTHFPCGLPSYLHIVPYNGGYSRIVLFSPARTTKPRFLMARSWKSLTWRPGRQPPERACVRDLVPTLSLFSPCDFLTKRLTLSLGTSKLPSAFHQPQHISLNGNLKFTEEAAPIQDPIPLTDTSTPGQAFRPGRGFTCWSMVARTFRGNPSSRRT